MTAQAFDKFCNFVEQETRLTEVNWAKTTFV